MTVENNHNKIIFLGAGGTGGHLFPAEALGEELIGRGYQIHLVTDHRGARFSGALQNIPVHKVSAATFKAGLLNKIKTLFSLGLGLLQSFYLLLRFKPVVVVGFGGYPSFPIMKAAQILRLKNMIHDQNGVLGKANLYLAPQTTLIATSLPDTAGIREHDRDKIVFTGNPVRPAICHARFTPYTKPEADGEFRLFVVGGSQGARIFSDIVPKAIEQLPTPLQKRLKLVQQCRLDDVEKTKTFYKNLHIDATVAAFFDNIADIFAKSHLIISRSGASSVSEIATVGRPAIFVPFPHADNQQTINASSLVEQEAAWLMAESGFNTQSLSQQLETLMQVPNTLEAVAHKAKDCAKPAAAKDLADIVENLIQQQS